jgi:hypothetical protein
MFKKNIFLIFLLFAIEMAVLSVFWQKKGLGPLGVNGVMGISGNMKKFLENHLRKKGMFEIGSVDFSFF